MRARDGRAVQLVGGEEWMVERERGPALAVQAGRPMVKENEDQRRRVPLQAPCADLLLRSPSSGTPPASCAMRRRRRPERGLVVLHGIHGRRCLLPMVHPLWVPRPSRRTYFHLETKRVIEKIDPKMEDETQGSGTRLGVLKDVVAHRTNLQRPLRRRPPRRQGQSNSFAH